MTYGNTPSFNAETECKRLWVVMGDCAAQQTELIVDVMKIASRMEQLEEEIKTVCVSMGGLRDVVDEIMDGEVVVKD